ncbi:MAG TPA: DNA-processing protein DprA, partial [Rhodobacteraceae bacterium]|nr:DNA-processing protein DprA [Paracoccaceae bacterium]
MRGLSIEDTTRRDWLRLIRSENVGPATFWKLINRFGGAAAALDYLSAGDRAGRNKQPLRLYSTEQAEREMEQARRLGARLVARSEPDYPGWLNHIHGAPPLLYVKGDAGLLRRPIIAIAGSRNASAIGLRLTTRIAVELGAAGFVIVSGLARGIDAAAHNAALATGTIAVLAGGIDVIYPPENRVLHGKIAGQGVLVSEMPPGTEPRAR